MHPSGQRAGAHSDGGPSPVEHGGPGWLGGKSGTLLLSQTPPPLPAASPPAELSSSSLPSALALPLHLASRSAPSSFPFYNHSFSASPPPPSVPAFR
jgi:hypothetical protein